MSVIKNRTYFKPDAAERKVFFEVDFRLVSRSGMKCP